MFTLSALAAGAARLRQALRASGRRCAPAAAFFPRKRKLPLRVIEHARACRARPAMLAPSALAAGVTSLRQALAPATGAARLQRRCAPPTARACALPNMKKSQTKY